MITVRRLTSADIPACRSLWQARFFDSDAFMDWYFQDRFNPDLSFGLFDDGMLRSMAHGRSLQLRFGDAIVPALMIGGVSTASDCEGRGYMRQVLDAMREAAKTDGIPLLVLATETPAIYKSSGYTVCAEMLHGTADGSAPIPPCLDVSAFDLDGLTACCNAAGKNYHFFPVRTANAMQSRLHELFCDGAGLFTLRAKDGSIEGYAVYHPENNFAEEVLARSVDGYRSLLAALPAGATAVLPPNLPFDGHIDGAKLMCLPLDEQQLPGGWNTGVCFCPETF